MNWSQSENHMNSKQVTPGRLFLLLTVLIAAIEYGVMHAIALFHLTPVAASLVDSALLVLVLFPFLYLLGYMPFQKNFALLAEAKEKIESTHDRLLAVLDSIDAIVYVADMKSYEVLFINEYMKKIFGDITGKICWQSIQTDQSGPCTFCTNDKLIGPDGLPLGMYQWEFQNTVNGHWYYIHDRAIRWLDGRIVRLEIATDITHRKTSEETILKQNSFLQNVIESLPYPFYVVNADSYDIELANSIAKEQGIGTGTKCYAATHKNNAPCNSKEHQCPLNLVKDKGTPVIVEHIHPDHNGEEKYVEIHGYPITDQDDRITKMIEYQIDITNRKKIEEKLKKISVTDEMTGIYNRRGFLMLAEQQLMLADRIPGEIYIIYVDCNKLKWINDTLGHELGDSFIKETADLLKHTFRQVDIIGRIGGDEFVVLCMNEAGSDNAATLEKRLADSIAAKNQEPNRQFPFSLSYGISHHERTTPCSIQTLISQADQMMYRHKNMTTATD